MGTTVDNDNGPWIYSGDAGAFGHGYLISKAGANGPYDESPFQADDAQGTADAITAAMVSQDAWMDYYDAEWPAMHAWLSGISGTHRTRCWTLCKGIKAIAALL